MGQKTYPLTGKAQMIQILPFYHARPFGTKAQTRALASFSSLSIFLNRKCMGAFIIHGLGESDKSEKFEGLQEGWEGGEVGWYQSTLLLPDF